MKWFPRALVAPGIVSVVINLSFLPAFADDLMLRCDALTRIYNTQTPIVIHYDASTKTATASANGSDLGTFVDGRTWTIKDFDFGEKPGVDGNIPDDSYEPCDARGLDYVVETDSQLKFGSHASSTQACGSSFMDDQNNLIYSVKSTDWVFEIYKATGTMRYNGAITDYQCQVVPGNAIP